MLPTPPVQIHAVLSTGHALIGALCAHGVLARLGYTGPHHQVIELVTRDGRVQGKLQVSRTPEPSDFLFLDYLLSPEPHLQEDVYAAWRELEDCTTMPLIFVNGLTAESFLTCDITVA